MKSGFYEGFSMNFGGYQSSSASVNDISQAMTKMMFDDPGLFDHLNGIPIAGLNTLGFGVIGFDRECRVRRYSDVEAKRAGLAASVIIGTHMFEQVAQCMNNYMVAQRFHDALEFNQELDVTMDYVLTFRMRPTHVKLRLPARPDVPMRYVLVQPAA